MRTHGFLLSLPSRHATDHVVTASAGFLATLAITTTIYILPAFGLPQVDLPIWVARLATSGTVNVAALGLLVHFLVGLAFAWAYATRVEPRLALSPVRAGAVYGVALWLFVQAMAVPALGALSGAFDGSASTPGPLSYRLGGGAALASLIAHLAYGVVLGFAYGCRAGGQCRTTHNPAHPRHIPAHR